MNAVACPYFSPRNKLATGLWVHEPRWPLGDAYMGFCHSRVGDPYEPSEQHQEDLCNYGYARGLCERFVEGSPADAVRFSVVSEERERLRLIYILEKDHAPVAFGTLEFSGGELPTPPSDALLARQAEAFVKAYLARSGPARDGISKGLL